MKKCSLCPNQVEDEQYKRCARCRARKAKAFREWKARLKERDPAKHRALRHWSTVRAGIRRYKERNAERCKQMHQELFRKWKLANGERLQLRRKLHAAIAKGEIERPAICSSCGAGDCKIVPFLGVETLAEITWPCWKCHARRSGVSKR